MIKGLAIGAVILAVGGTALYMGLSNASQSGRQKDGLFAGACTVAKKSDISSLLGTSYKNGVSTKPSTDDPKAPTTVCRYDPSTTKVADLVKLPSLTVNLQTFDSEAAAKSAFATVKNSTDTTTTHIFTAHTIDSLGNEAFQLQGKNGMIAKTEENIYVRSGRQIIQLLAVNLSGIDHDKSKAALIDIAKRALQ